MMWRSQHQIIVKLSIMHWAVGAAGLICSITPVMQGSHPWGV